MAWSPDSTRLLTSSGDKTCKLWDVETKSVVSEFIIGNQVEDQQVCYFKIKIRNSECLNVMILFLGVLFMARKLLINCFS